MKVSDNLPQINRCRSVAVSTKQFNSKHTYFQTCHFLIFFKFVMEANNFWYLILVQKGTRKLGFVQFHTNILLSQVNNLVHNTLQEMVNK